jgi:hypothetical protein
MQAGIAVEEKDMAAPKDEGKETLIIYNEDRIYQ